MKLALDELIAKYDIEVLLHAPVVSAERSTSNIVTSVTIQDRRGQTSFRGRAFVDASGDCDLSYHAGASVRYGNHGTINLGTLSTRFGGLKDANPSSALWKDAISAAKRENPKLAAMIPKVSSVQLRLPRSGDVTTYLASASYDARVPESITSAERKGRMQGKCCLTHLTTSFASIPNHSTPCSRFWISRRRRSDTRCFGPAMALNP